SELDSFPTRRSSDLLQRSSGMSHCTQTVGPSISALKKTVPERSRARQGQGGSWMASGASVRGTVGRAASLTALEAHVSIGLCPSDGNGFRNNFRDKFASQNGAERIAPPPWRDNG